MVCDASWLAGAPSSLPDPYRRSPERLRTFIAHLPFCCISRGSPQQLPDGKKGSPYPQLRRSWAVSQDPSRSISKDKFSVVSYNILGDDNASKHNDLYSHIPSHFMRWDQRKRLIFKEVMVLDPDILCLQEVDRFDDILINMKGRGYVGTFKRRTGVARDGCALFWKENLFYLLERESIEFKGFGLRDNVAQLFVFEMSNSRRVLVGNIHVLFNPNRGDIKLGQMRLLLQKARALSDKWGGLPVVLAGDFNSTPQSAIYKFLTSSKLNLKMYERRQLSGQNSCQTAHSFGMERRQPYRVFKTAIKPIQLPPQPPCINPNPSASSIAASFSEKWLSRRITQLTISLTRPIGMGSRNPGSIDMPPPKGSFKYYWSEEELLIASGDPKCTKLEHPLKLYSSYANVKGSRRPRTRDSTGEPLATTYHSKFIGTVDYIWYSDGLSPQKVLDPVPINILQEMGGLPSQNEGSDHLALACEFAFTEEA